jgi:hypothetical protein
MTTTVAISDTKDYEGIDEWYVCAFDENGDHSSDEMMNDEETQHGSFAWCVEQAAKFISEHNTIQWRICIMRVM